MTARILLLQQRKWGLGIGHELAKRFQRDGCRLAALTFKKSTDVFTRQQTDVSYDFVVSHDAIFESQVVSTTTLERICTELGIESVWPLTMTMRNLVYSYSEKYYYSFRQNRSDEDIVAYVKNLFDGLITLFDGFKPNLIVQPNFVAMAQLVIGLLAKQREIPLISFTDSKISGVIIPATTPDLNEGPFISRVHKLNAGTLSPNRRRAEEYIEKFRQRFVQPDYARDYFNQPRGLDRLSAELRPYRQVLRFLQGHGRENYVKTLGATIDYRPPRIILRDHYAAKRYRKMALRRTYPDFDQLGSFIYMPLQVQPEAQIDVWAVHFANQIETARQVAMSLPGHYTLAVKEHPAMIARRSPTYHDKLARLPNVQLLDPRLPTERILARADMVISVGGTSLAEAAFYRKPAIQLGRLGTTLVLPNVTRHTDMTTLTDAINAALLCDLETDEYERRLCNYVAAAYDTGIQMNFDKVWYTGGTSEDYDAIYRSCQSELQREQSCSQSPPDI